MKTKLMLLVLAIVYFESCTTERVDYENLLGHHISNPKVESFIESLGSDYEYNDKWNSHRYIYKDKGFELVFTEKDTLDIMFFITNKLNPETILPYDIKPNETRKSIEEKIGKAESYFSGFNLIAKYPKKNIKIKYNSKDSTNMNNSIKLMTISK